MLSLAGLSRLLSPTNSNLAALLKSTSLAAGSGAASGSGGGSAAAGPLASLAALQQVRNSLGSGSGGGGAAAPAQLSVDWAAKLLESQSNPSNPSLQSVLLGQGTLGTMNWSAFLNEVGAVCAWHAVRKLPQADRAWAACPARRL